MAEGQLLKVKAPGVPSTFDREYYQLEGDLLVLRQSYQDGLISALVPARPAIYPGTEVSFLPREPAAGVIQGPVQHAIPVGEGCALQIANFGDIPPLFGERQLEVEIQRLQGSIRLPVVEQSFQYSFSGTELLNVVLAGFSPDQFPAGSWVRFHSV